MDFSHLLRALCTISYTISGLLGVTGSIKVPTSRDLRSGGQMTDYRLYLLTRGDRIDRHIALACDDDEHAIAEMSLHIVAAEGAELWRGSRLVRRIAPSPPLKPLVRSGPASHP